MTLPSIKTLDCTLRDGGYYNGWDFSPEVVQRYLNAMSMAGISVVEIGFRNFPQNQFLGPYAYSTDLFISNLNLPKNLQYAVMINAKDILNQKQGVEAALLQLFNESSKSPIDMVRIAAHFEELQHCLPIVTLLKKLGYTVGLNLMQIGGKTEEEILGAVKGIDQWPIDVLYFADSLGNMTPSDITTVVFTLKKAWAGALGVHSHDNMMNALKNALAAIDCGVTWVDSTVLGMGRGPGNARSEYLLLELNRRHLGSHNTDLLFHLALNEFTQLHSQYGWGSNLFYYLSASYGIHPTYVQEMMSDDRYKVDDILSALNYLKSCESKSFNLNSLNRALEEPQIEHPGTWSPTGVLLDQDVLIIGPGEETKRHRDGLIDFIKRKKPFVISLNVNPYIPSEWINLYAVCNTQRFIMDAEKYTKLQGKPILCPRLVTSGPAQSSINLSSIWDYGLSIDSKQFIPGETSCIIPSLLVASYVLAFCVEANARQIFLAGLDGYDANNSRYAQMNQVFNTYRKQPDWPTLTAITPTKYSVPQSSIYAPII
jgi:4-hydroxy 2-oxovalerate aldolase